MTGSQDALLHNLLHASSRQGVAQGGSALPERQEVILAMYSCSRSIPVKLALEAHDALDKDATHVPILAFLARDAVASASALSKSVSRSTM